MEGGISLDKWGHPVKTSSEACISAINAYYDQVLRFGRERRVILDAVNCDADCVLANILAAHFLSVSDPLKAQSHCQAARFRLEESTPYERAVFLAVSSLISHDRDDDAAYELHSKLLDEFPKDLCSLKRAQILCFYMGRPDLSLILTEKVLSVNKHEEYVHGMHAFPLLELSRMAEAADATRKAIDINKNDAWAQHCTCHVLHYECRFKDAIEFMEDCSSSWNSCLSFLLTHNWWHVALCYLDCQKKIEKVLKIYDDHIWEELEKEDAVPAEVYLNALSLLLLLYVRGEQESAESRLSIVSKHVSNRAFWHMEWHLDIYIIWALTQTGDHSAARDLINSMRSRISSKCQKKQQQMQKPIRLAEAMHEYGKAEHERAYQLLGPTFCASDYKIIGASEEQLDVFSQMWYRILIDSGRASRAVEIVREQVEKRETPFLWRLLEMAYTITGSSEASSAGIKAVELEAAYSV